jgi:hypothetical protein
VLQPRSGYRKNDPSEFQNPRMSAEQVALIPRCAECLDVWLPDDAERWSAYLDADSELVFYCPDACE